MVIPTKFLLPQKLAANIWSDEQKLHIRHMTVGKVAKQTKAL